MEEASGIYLCSTQDFFFFFFLTFDRPGQDQNSLEGQGREEYNRIELTDLVDFELSIDGPLLEGNR